MVVMDSEQTTATVDSIICLLRCPCIENDMFSIFSFKREYNKQVRVETVLWRPSLKASRHCSLVVASVLLYCSLSMHEENALAGLWQLPQDSACMPLLATENLYVILFL